MPLREDIPEDYYDINTDHDCDGCARDGLPECMSPPCQHCTCMEYKVDDKWVPSVEMSNYTEHDPEAERMKKMLRERGINKERARLRGDV